MQFHQPYFYGERQNTENNAAKFCANPNLIIPILLRNYRVGLAPFYMPVFAKYGYNLAAVKIFYIIYFSILLLLFYSIFQRHYYWVSPFTTYFMVVPLYFILSTLRTYKWHAVMLICVVALYMSGKGCKSKKPWLHWLLSFIIILFCSLLYRGAFLFLPLLVIQIIIDPYPEKNNPREK